MATDADVCLIGDEASVWKSLFRPVCVCKSDLFIRMNETPESSAGFRIITNDIIRMSDDGRKRHTVKLRPAPLFRTVGLTGLSASLPPHRRLRSVLHMTRTTPGHSVDQSHPLPGRPRRNPPLNGLKCTQTQDRPLPNIFGQKHNEISMIKQPQSVGIQHWHHGGRLNTTATACGKDSRITPDKYLFEEEREPKMRTKKSKYITMEMRKDEPSDLSLWIQNLEITDRKREKTPERRRNEQSGCGNWAEPVCKEAGQMRRDRRPHFLPPITQSDCLLNVPLLLPDNSPPPSPCSPSDIRFFPLSVPHIQPFPRESRGDAAAQHD